MEPLENTLTYLETICLYVACEGLWGILDAGCVSSAPMLPSD